jgi:hypothetical protein
MRGSGLDRARPGQLAGGHRRSGPCRREQLLEHESGSEYLPGFGVEFDL